MAKTEKEVVYSTLTKTQARVLNAIAAEIGMESTDKKIIAKRDGEKIKGPSATLIDKDGNPVVKVDGVDIAKVCRQLHREDLVLYGWNEDRSRYIAITGEGFNQLQLPLKERTFPAKKEKAEGEEGAEKPKKEKKSKDKTPAPAAPAADEPQESADEEPEVPVVKPNPLMNNFIVIFRGRKKIHKAKDEAEFRELSKRAPEEWAYLFEEKK